MGFVPQLDESDAEVPKVLLVEHGKVARWSQRDLQQWTAGCLEGLANLVMFTKSEHIVQVCAIDLTCLRHFAENFSSAAS